MEISSIIGQILALTCAVFWAGNSLTYGLLGKKIDSFNIAATRSLFALPMVLLLAIIFEQDAILHISKTDWLALLASGVIGYFLTDILLFRAYVYIGARKAMVIMTVSPIFTSIISVFLFNEFLTLIQCLGILLTIAGIIIMILGDKDDKEENENKKNYKKGILYSFLGSLFQTISYILARYALYTVPAFTTNTVRNLGGFICFFIYFIIFRKAFMKKQRNFNNRDIGFLLLAVITGPVLCMSFQMQAFALAPVGIVTALSQMSPVVLLPVDRFAFKKKLNIAAYGGTFISIAGVILLLIH